MKCSAAGSTRFFRRSRIWIFPQLNISCVSRSEEERDHLAETLREADILATSMGSICSLSNATANTSEDIHPEVCLFTQTTSCSFTRNDSGY
ncbi:MAG: hypothetical protein IPI11_14815 [Haliscomenobacter sp.]|nr:hypothetical protein [Haliscomenobacter sp.]